MNIKSWLVCFTELLLGCRARGPLEVMQGPAFKGPALLSTVAGASQFAGRTAIASGGFVTISTAVVNSDSLILATLQVNTTTASGGMQTTYGVNSVVSGVSFAFGALDGVGKAVTGTVMWEIRRLS